MEDLFTHIARLIAETIAKLLIQHAAEAIGKWLTSRTEQIGAQIRASVETLTQKISLNIQFALNQDEAIAIEKIKKIYHSWHRGRISAQSPPHSSTPKAPQSNLYRNTITSA